MMTSATWDHHMRGHHQYCVKCESETNGRRDRFLGCCVSDSVNNDQRGAIVIFNCLMYSLILASYGTSQLMMMKKNDKRGEYTVIVCTSSIVADSNSVALNTSHDENGKSRFATHPRNLCVDAHTHTSCPATTTFPAAIYMRAERVAGTWIICLQLELYCTPKILCETGLV